MKIKINKFLEVGGSIIFGTLATEQVHILAGIPDKFSYSLGLSASLVSMLFYKFAVDSYKETQTEDSLLQFTSKKPKNN